MTKLELERIANITADNVLVFETKDLDLVYSNHGAKKTLALDINSPKIPKFTDLFKNLTQTDISVRIIQPLIQLNWMPVEIKTQCQDKEVTLSIQLFNNQSDYYLYTIIQSTQNTDDVSLNNSKSADTSPTITEKNEPDFFYMDSLQSAIALYDNELTCKYINKAMQVLCGVAGNTVKGSKKMSFIPCADSPEFEELIIKALHEKTIANTIFRTTIAGNPVLLKTNVSPLLKHNTQQVGIIITIDQEMDKVTEVETTTTFAELNQQDNLAEEEFRKLNDQLLKAEIFEVELQEQISTLERKNSIITTLQEITSNVLNQQDINTILKQIYCSCKNLTNATCGYISIVNLDRQDKDIIYSEPENIDDENATTSTSTNELAVPIILNGTIIGTIVLKNKPKGFTQDDKIISTTFAELAAITLNETKIKKELIGAKEKAEENDKLKTAFLSNISHEIRTPMNGIVGFAELLITPGLSDDNKHSFARIILESCNQLVKIVNDILDISKLETNQLDLFEREFNLNNVILEIFAEYQAKASERNLNFYPYKGLADDQAEILSDEQRIRQIMSNLLSNAFKFTTSGYISFGYTLQHGYLEFYIKDTGIGIPEELHEKIFERFSQVEMNMNRNYGGTGLGLAISKGIVNLMGGNVRVESSSGKGATIYFTIPYKPSNNIGQYHHDNPQSCILLVEDQEVNFLFIKTIAEIDGYTLIHARSGLEAITYCTNNQDIDLVLMDICLPEMNGLDATRQIKKIRPHLPIIANSAYDSGEDRRKASEAGCDDFLAKPVNIDKLKTLIHKYTNRNKKTINIDNN